MKKTMKCIPIGGATVDIIIQVASKDADRLTMHNTDTSFMMVELGRKIETDAIHISVGGGAINASVAMARLGHTVIPIAKIKDDVNGKKIVQLLKTENIYCQNIYKTATYPTATSVLLSSIERDPTVFTYRGANTQLTNGDITPQMLHGADLVYITALSGNSAKTFPHIVQMAKAANAFVATNPGILQIQRYGDHIIKNLAYIDCLTLNIHEASQLMPAVTNTKPAKISIPDTYIHTDKMQALKSGLGTRIAEFIKSIVALGVKYIGITDGKNGAYMGTADGIYFAPAHPTKVAGTLGAGDAFASTLTTFLAQAEHTPETALMAGSLNSASVVSYTDTQTGLLTAKHIQSQLTPHIMNNIIFMPYI